MEQKPDVTSTVGRDDITYIRFLSVYSGMMEDVGSDHDFEIWRFDNQF